MPDGNIHTHIMYTSIQAPKIPKRRFSLMVGMPLPSLPLPLSYPLRRVGLIDHVVLRQTSHRLAQVLI